MPQKGTSTLRMRVCRQCGIEFMGGPRAWYCPTCRIERQREQGRTCKQRQRKGQTRWLGSIDKCEVCGKDYIVNSARQRYCPDCAPERYREVDREQSRGWLKRAVEKHGEEYFKDHLKRKREFWHKFSEYVEWLEADVERYNNGGSVEWYERNDEYPENAYEEFSADVAFSYTDED